MPGLESNYANIASYELWHDCSSYGHNIEYDRLLFKHCACSKVGTSLLCFYFHLLCYAAVLLKFTYYTQYYAQEQGLWSEYYAICIQVCINNSLHIANNLRKTVLLQCIYEWYQNIA